MYRLGLSLVLAFSFFACTAEVQTQPVAAGGEVQVTEQVGPPAEVVVQAAPPPVQVEVVPVAPSARHVWVAGHHQWINGRWVWVRGRYIVGRSGCRWIP